jgi:4-alpha-glucanotransferase
MVSRRAGLLVPLFSLASTRGWGIGEIADIERITGWLDRAGQRVLQLLPINEMPPGETSPYSALSAMAIDPQFITMDGVEDFLAVGGEASMTSERRRRLDGARSARAIDYAAVRELKHHALRCAFTHFRDVELAGGTRRAVEFKAYRDEQSWWLEEYTLFRALHVRYDERAWIEWPPGLRDRQPEALEAARVELADDILFRAYLQWIASDQWARARARGNALFGDLPFMVGGDSADVWATQDEFRLDASAGAPPDAFSETGQDWALPVYRWDVVASRDFDWLRQRARRNADLFDGYRVDHVVGFYRSYYRVPATGESGFVPEDEGAQLALGEQVLSVFREPGTEIIAEDLGTVPDFVRASLARLEVPGYRVFRWERQWSVEGQPFIDPLDYSPRSVATSGTHDTEPMVLWWETAPRDEREAVLAIPSVAGRMLEADRIDALEATPLSETLRGVLTEVLFASGSDLLILPIQDVFGWRDRINQPATVGTSNWTWRLPWPSDRLGLQPEAIAVADRLGAWQRRYKR